jgi:hypothetical protein
MALLSCPDEQNYAAIAKQLHETALEAEARIFELERTLRSAVNRPTIIWTSTALVTGIPANVEWRVGPAGGDGSWVSSFDNTGLVPFEFPDSTTVIAKLGAGVYEVGININFQPSVLVDDNSERLLRILHYRPDPTSLSGKLQINQAAYFLFEPSAGVGIDFSLIGTFNMQPNDWIEYNFLHSNVNSDMDSPAGAITWIHKLSTANSLVVV